MPSTPQRGFIVRPPQVEAEPEFESLNVQACSDHYSFTRDGIPVFSDTVSSSSVEERIKDKMLEKMENYLESNQLNELSVLAAVYQKFKELHP